jgi:hypothetical protein
MGRAEVGVRLVALCWMIDESVGHADASSDLETLSSMCAELNYSLTQINAMLDEAGAGYEADRGWGLVRAAFPEQAQSSDGGS